MIGKETVIGRANGIVGSKMDGEVVMMNIEKGKYYCLDEVASRIWDIIEEEKSVEEVVDVLLNEYDVSKDECMNDVVELFENLFSQDLITIKG